MSSGDHESDDSEEAVKVFVRIRPLNKREIAEKQTIGWDFNETSMLEDTQNGQRVYAYDHCFGPNGNNQETYDIVGKPVVLKAMEGYNGTVFTYGQTGSGKTWTMRGCESDPGMMILCIRDIMGWITSHPKIKYTLRISYLEVYNEEINDLLGEPGSPNSKNLKIVSEDSVRGAVIGGLVEEIAQTPEDFMAILQRGESSRSYASTEMNSESSRSHTIYRVTIESQELQENGAPAVGGKVAYLNLVDLAGSERQKSTKAEGKTLKEGSNINKSLLALGAVINKLGEATKKGKSGGKQAFIPYRDSKLTRILKQSLGGNTLTSMLCAVTPAPMHREETVSTLKFGQLCKSIKNSVKSNDGAIDDKTLMKQYRFQINDLKAKLEAASKGIVSADPESALGQALKDKSDLEVRVHALEAMVVAAGGSVDGELVASAGEGGSAGAGGRGPSREEVDVLNAQVAEKQELITVLQRNLEEYQDLEEAKAAFEDYQQHSAQELDEGIAKLEEEKQTLQNERYKMLKDRSNIDEKETRIGSLITNIDEKESKLRQMLGTMKEQQDQWQRSITDLQRREDLVDDWQKNHSQREKRLQETDAMQERKFAELNKREADLSEEEQKFKISQKELLEREQRLQVALSRVANSEQTLGALEEKLNAYETSLKKKENDADIRDRELISRRKEMESWDVLLREKDRKISVEQRNLDERETSVRATEEKARQRDVESERRMLELRQNEAAVADQMEAVNKLQAELEERDSTTQEQMRICAELKEALATKESDLLDLERRLMKLQERMSGIELRETELKQRIEHHKGVEDEFFNVKVAQITARHGRELAQLEQVVSQQLKITADFQKQLDDARAELGQKCSQIEEFEVAMEERDSLIEQLREHLAQSDMGSANSQDTGMESESQQIDSEDEGGGGGVGDDHSSSQHRSHHHHQHGNHHGSGGGGKGRESSTGSNLPHTYHQPQQQQPQTQVDSQQQPLSANLSHDDTGAGAGAGMYDHSLNTNNNTAAAAAALAKKPPAPPTSGQEFVLQLAATQRMLYHILEKHDAVPDRNGAVGNKSRQRQSPRRLYQQQLQIQQQQQEQLLSQQQQQLYMQQQMLEQQQQSLMNSPYSNPTSAVGATTTTASSFSGGGAGGVNAVEGTVPTATMLQSANGTMNFGGVAAAVAGGVGGNTGNGSGGGGNGLQLHDLHLAASDAAAATSTVGGERGAGGTNMTNVMAAEGGESMLKRTVSSRLGPGGGTGTGGGDTGSPATAAVGLTRGLSSRSIGSGIGGGGGGGGGGDASSTKSGGSHNNNNNVNNGLLLHHEGGEGGGVGPIGEEKQEEGGGGGGTSAIPSTSPLPLTPRAGASATTSGNNGSSAAAAAVGGSVMTSPSASSTPTTATATNGGGGIGIGIGAGRTPNTAGGGGGTGTGVRTSPYYSSAVRGSRGRGNMNNSNNHYSPHGAPAAGSPDIASLVTTGELRNGIPVTTVNLGLLGGLKRSNHYPTTSTSSPGSALSPKHK